MSCSHSHSHTHTDCHHPAPQAEASPQQQSALKRVLWITSLYLIAEVIGGLYTGSLALLADAGHMLADVGALGLALFASWMAHHYESAQKTYGYYRVEILSALTNGIILIGTSAWIVYEAFTRLSHPPVIQGDLMMGITLGGLLVNLFAVFTLHGAHQESLNIKGAYLHVLGDLLGSVGAVIAAILITQQQLYLADPIISIVIAVLILMSALKLVSEAVNILLESCPGHIHIAQVEAAMTALPTVISVHDLHVWTIASGKDALSAHVTITPEANPTETLQQLQQCLKTQFGLSHLTLQLEPEGFEEDEIHF